MLRVYDEASQPVRVRSADQNPLVHFAVVVSVPQSVARLAMVMAAVPGDEQDAVATKAARRILTCAADRVIVETADLLNPEVLRA